MTAFPTTIPVRLDREGRIDVDVNCPACGYNLRMQKPAAECPECGEAIDVTDAADDDRLAAADPDWRATITRGAWLLFFGMAILPLGAVPGLVVLAVGLWLLTTREPDKPEAWFHRGTRLSARLAVVLAASGGVALGVLLIARVAQSGWRLSFRIFDGVPGATGLLAIDERTYDILFAGVAASLAVAMLEAWRYLFKLAARADGPNVARACRKAWKRYLLGVGVILVLALIANVTDGLDWRPDWLMKSSYFLAAGGVLLVSLVCLWLWVVTLLLTHRLSKLLRAESPASA